MHDFCTWYQCTNVLRIYSFWSLKTLPSRLFQNLFISPETEEKLMLGEFKCDQPVFVHLFRKEILFDINGSTEFLSTQMRTFFANLFQNSLCKSHARR